MPNFTGPSVNLSNLLNTYETGPPQPLVQQAPKMKQDINVEEIDQISVASSSDYSEIDVSTKTISLPKSRGKKPKGKSITI